MIENCTIKNKKEWLRLRIALWPNSPIEKLIFEMDTFLANPDTFAQYLVRSDNGNVIAFVEAAIRSDYVNGTKNSPVAFLEGIFVDPSFRRQGIARQLVEHITTWAVSKGVKELASDALLENVDSHAMHKALGFRETERVVYFQKNVKC